MTFQDPTPAEQLARDAFNEVKAERDIFLKALEEILVETNFISLSAVRDYVSEILRVGIYAP